MDEIDAETLKAGFELAFRRAEARIHVLRLGGNDGEALRDAESELQSARDNLAEFDLVVQLDTGRTTGRTAKNQRTKLARK